MGFGMCGQKGKNLTAQQALDSVAATAQSGILRLYDMLGVRSPGIGGCNTSAGVPSATPPQAWFSPTAATAGGFSAICLLTAQQLFVASGGAVPIGAVESAWGGTRINSWTPQEPSDPWANEKGAGMLWEKYVLPFVPFTFAGVLWDQGEADEGSAWPNTKQHLVNNATPAEAYAQQFPLMIQRWRTAFDMPVSGERIVPFVYVEMDCAKESFWLAQRSASALPAVGFATTVDINAHATHPPDKEVVSIRMAWELRRIANSSLGGGSAGVPSRPRLIRVSGSGSGGVGGGVAADVMFEFDGPIESRSGGGGGGGGPVGKNCGSGGPDSTAIDYGAWPNTKLNYSVTGSSVTVQCGKPGAIVELSSRLASCFLYNKGGLPVAPLCALCNQTQAVCAPRI